MNGQDTPFKHTGRRNRSAAAIKLAIIEQEIMRTKKALKKKGHSLLEGRAAERLCILRSIANDYRQINDESIRTEMS